MVVPGDEPTPSDDDASGAVRELLGLGPRRADEVGDDDGGGDHGGDDRAGTGPGGDRADDRTPAVAGSAVLVACGLGVLGALWLRWITANLSGERVALRGIDLDWARFGFVAFGLAMVAFGVWGVVRPRRRPAAGGVVAATAVAVLAGLLILAVEVVSGLVPKDLVPVTIRRLSVRIGAGVGLWATLLAALVALLAATGGIRLAVARWQRLQGEGALPAAAAGQALLVVGAVVLGIGRYERAFEAEAAGQVVLVEGWSAPWFGPGTVLALWLVVLATAVLLVRGSVAASCVALVGAWLATFLAALVLLLGDALDWAEPLVLARLPDQAAVAEPAIGLGPAPTWVFVGGLLAGVGALLTARHAAAGAEG